MSHWAVTRTTSVVKRLLGSRSCPTGTKDILGKTSLCGQYKEGWRVLLRRSKVRFHFPLLKAVKAGSDLWPCLSYLCGLEAHSTCFPMSSMKNPQGPNQEAKFWRPPSSQTVPASSDLFSLATSFLSSRNVKLTRNFLGKLFHSQKVTVDPLRSWSTLRQLRHDRDFYKSGRTWTGWGIAA